VFAGPIGIIDAVTVTDALEAIGAAASARTRSHQCGNESAAEQVRLRQQQAAVPGRCAGSL
jgi:hypothetical protein